ncbi:uncharacterized protein L3040_003009 [Drepanopeziza brunnea f. sp. 'multigermtubi']|uniref:uncharacterized protein n=1 Tax=Drepanopeziza brunnea f. sp. 'multigermtubi' TaxID=698441 RepID=UPI00239050DE|nr:hypothetical protein L3040_003009 [Drepanopeziza brunnea f. sp. 'multigermtubi']
MNSGELEPPIRESIKQITPSIWTISTSILCYALPQIETPPAHPVLASWTDGAQIFCLTQRADTSPPVPASGQGDSTTGRVYDAGRSTGVWFIGNEAVIKVKSWFPGQQSEASTTAFVREHASSIRCQNRSSSTRTKLRADRSS